MTHRLVVINANERHSDTIIEVAERNETATCRVADADEDGNCRTEMLVGPQERQDLLDELQECLGDAEDWSLFILPVEATLPAPPENEEDGGQPVQQTREELFDDVARGSRLDWDFVMLAALSTVVASVGLLTDSVAVVIGAMVIAPLLGPNLALSLGVAIGDLRFIYRSLRTNAVGLAITVAVGAFCAFVFNGSLDSDQLMSRTQVDLGNIALALASGTAAALTLTSGVSAALVGVMVAVALLPPAAAIGIFLGTGDLTFAVKAGILLAVNVSCVNLATQAVFILRGIKPRKWIEKRAARQSILFSAGGWSVLLIVLVVAILMIDSGR